MSKDMMIYFTQSVWPRIVKERGLSSLVQPNEQDFRNWFASIEEHTGDSLD